MRLGPFWCADAARHECREPRPVLLCMGLFSRFCVRALRLTGEEAHASAAHEIVSALRLTGQAFDGQFDGSVWCEGSPFCMAQRREHGEWPVP